MIPAATAELQTYPNSSFDSPNSFREVTFGSAASPIGVRLTQKPTRNMLRLALAVA
jgi:hypothetical protein